MTQKVKIVYFLPFVFVEFIDEEEPEEDPLPEVLLVVFGFLLELVELV